MRELNQFQKLQTNNANKKISPAATHSLFRTVIESETSCDLSHLALLVILVDYGRDVIADSLYLLVRFNVLLVHTLQE